MHLKDILNFLSGEGSKEKRVEKLLKEHFYKVEKAVNGFAETMNLYYDKADERDFKDASYRVNLTESEADNIRREIYALVGQGAFLPAFREDIINFVENLDKVAGQCERVCKMYVLERPDIPDSLLPLMKQLVSQTLEEFKPLKKAFEMLDEDMVRSLEFCAEVEKIEKAIDKTEWDLKKEIFNSDMELAKKLQLRDIVTQMALISDFIENVSDKIEIVAMKRRV